MITLTEDFRQEILDVQPSGLVLLGRQRLERTLLLTSLSGYASEYKRNASSHACARGVR